jgi:Arc/MetJ-type ribon-helix-helix transcriptional regulator
VRSSARARRPPEVSDQPSGMVDGMATRKVTVTLDADQLDHIRTLVEAGAAPSVSGFVQHAVGVALDDIAGWGAMLADALEATGGELSAEERRWADETLGNKRSRRSSAA